MKHVFSATIIVVGLIMYMSGVGRLYLIFTDNGVSVFLIVVGGIATLTGIRMQRASGDSRFGISKALGIISFFVFIVCALIALVALFFGIGMSAFVIVFSLGCSMVAALIQVMMEQTREQAS